MRRGTKFGNELRRLRISCGLTQQAVADALHVNRATYTYYETGKTTPSVERLGKIAEILGVTELHLAGLVFAYDTAAVVMGEADIILYIQVERYTCFGTVLSLISGILSVMSGIGKHS